MRTNDPLVLALDGKWGCGKTHFLKRWVGAHTLQHEGKAITVYFDAFANDYQNDPLTALIAAMLERLPEREKPEEKELKRTAVKLAKPFARIGLSMATFGATKAFNDFWDALAESVSREATGAIDKFWEAESDRRSSVQEFKAALDYVINSLS